MDNETFKKYETILNKIMGMSNCNIRKVGALLIRNEQIISEGYSGSGNCDTCPKYLAYVEGRGKMSKQVKCKYPHAEEMALVNAIKGDDILITNSPCQACAELIVDKEIGRVVYIQEYYDTKPIEYLRNNGIKVIKVDR